MCYQPIMIGGEAWNKQHKTDLPIMYVNCRQCLECRQTRAKEWALRCMFEASKYNNNNCFITLTYEKSPLVLVKKDVQDFIKRLRKHITTHKIKYFACGEYGEQKKRPHYHILIFNYDFADKYVYSKSNKGYNIYKSETLEKLWGKGLTTVQELTLNSAAYCALYSSPMKKNLPKYLQEHPEFNIMSQGLGLDMILDKMETYLQTDEIWFDGKRHNIPASALKKYQNGDFIETKEYQDLKLKRIEKANQNANYLKNTLINDIDFYTYYKNKKYLKENAINRLTKKL